MAINWKWESQNISKYLLFWCRGHFFLMSTEYVLGIYTNIMVRCACLPHLQPFTTTNSAHLKFVAAALLLCSSCALSSGPSLTIQLFPYHTHNFIVYHCTWSFIAEYTQEVARTHIFLTAVTQRPCQPNFAQLAGKTNNTLLLWFKLFSHHHQCCHIIQHKMSSSLLACSCIMHMWYF